MLRQATHIDNLRNTLGVAGGNLRFEINLIKVLVDLQPISIKCQSVCHNLEASQTIEIGHGNYIEISIN